MKNNAFSLIEVIVVLIILGVLAAMALPNYFSWVEASRKLEAYAQIGIMSKAFQACYFKELNTTVCKDSLNQNLSQYSTKYFDYQYKLSVSAIGVYIIADRNNTEISILSEGQLTCPFISGEPAILVYPTQYYAIGQEIDFTGGNIQIKDCSMEIVS